VSPDGTRLAVLDDGILASYSLATGERSTEVANLDTGGLRSAPAWQGDRLLLGEESGLVAPGTGEVVIAVDPRWQAGTVATWASGALAGPAHDGPGLSDWRYWSLWWQWRWLLGVGVAAAFVLLCGWLARRARGGAA
jgi:hypothetical protein